MTLLPGLSATVPLTVAAADTAPVLRSGDVPVLATPRLVALCEEATVATVAPFLAPGQTTVGTRVELDHLAPSLPGARVEATAVLETVAGRRLGFAVAAREGDRLLARGRIERVMVDRAEFLRRAGA
ncbi:MAG: thioesterase [Actinomycetota bacterium]